MTASNDPTDPWGAGADEAAEAEVSESQFEVAEDYYGDPTVADHSDLTGADHVADHDETLGGEFGEPVPEVDVLGADLGSEPAEVDVNAADASAAAAENNPAVAAPHVEEARFGPLTAPPSQEERDILPGMTDVAADMGAAYGIGIDELGLVRVEVNGLMGVAVGLGPGLVAIDLEQIGHHLAMALEEARAEVVGYLTEFFQRQPETAEWLTQRPDEDATGLAGGGAAPAAETRTCTSPDGLVTVLMASNGTVGSVLLNTETLDLAAVAQAFVYAAEKALQGGDDTIESINIAGRMAAFDQALDRLSKKLDALAVELD